MTITRRNSGSGHSYTVDGSHMPGVTTIISATTNKPALVRWAAGAAADYAINHWDELATQPLTERGAAMRRAPDQDRDTAARRGQEVHSLAERLMGGEEVLVPPELEGHVRAFEAYMEDWQPEAVLREVVLANRAVGYCGTADVVADLADRHRWLIDYKTNRSGVYGEAALQLIAYRNAEAYLDRDGVERQLADLGVDRVGVLHLRADGYSLREITGDHDLLWLYFRHLRWCYRHLDGQRDWIGPELPAPVRVAS